eukprot:gene779-biopygen7348
MTALGIRARGTAARNRAQGLEFCMAHLGLRHGRRCVIANGSPRFDAAGRTAASLQPPPRVATLPLRI